MSPGEGLEQAAKLAGFAAAIGGRQRVGRGRGDEAPQAPQPWRTLAGRKDADPRSIVTTLDRFEVRLIAIGASRPSRLDGNS